MTIKRKANLSKKLAYLIGIGFKFLSYDEMTIIFISSDCDLY
jgi:hypothetical protein